MSVRAIVAAVGFSCLSVLASAEMAAAKITKYECSFPQSKARGGGWVPEILIITDNDKSGEIIVFDPVIKYFVGKPITARRSGETKARVSYVWEYWTNNKGQSSRVTYSFSYFRNGQPAKIRVQPGSYDNTWSGEGTCKVAAG